MSKKQVNEGVPIGLSSSHVDGRMIFDYQVRSLEGKLLGLLESLGLTEKQEFAVKELLKDIFYRSMYFETEYILGEFVNDAITKSRERSGGAMKTSGDRIG